jgi:mono/diheme cytochrome c family protein
MWKEATLLSVFVCLGLTFSPQEIGKAQDKAHSEFKVPPEEAGRKNPIRSNPTTIGDGKRRYDAECAVCHGQAGDGKGDVVEELKLKLQDWRDPTALANVSDGEIFYIINKGKGAMPGEEGRSKPEQIWSMVIYLRSFSKGPQTKTADSKPPA